MLPRFLYPFFWDIDPETFEPRSYSEYTIGRILEYGDQEAVSWLRQNFRSDEIVAVLRCDRKLSRKSAWFWSLVYSVPANEVAALG